MKIVTLTALLFIGTTIIVVGRHKWAWLRKVPRNPSNVITPRYLKQWEEFAVRHDCRIDVYSQVDKDFQPFYEALRVNDKNHLRDQIKLFLNTSHERLRRCQIVRGKLEGDCSGYVSLLEPLAPLLPDMTIQLNELDEPRVMADTNPIDHPQPLEWTRTEPIQKLIETCSYNKTILSKHGFFIHPASLIVTKQLLPIFSQTKAPCFYDIVIPSEYNVGSAHAIQKEKERSDLPKPVPWDRKRNAIMWRGSTTGSRNDGETEWRDSHRFRLVRLAQEYQNKLHGVDIDFGFTIVIQADPVAYKTIENEFKLKDRIPMDAHWSFKYLMDVDGNSFSQRFYTFLHHDSLTFHAGLFVDWYTERVKPWVHYIPVSVTYEDFADNLKWVVDHDDEAKEITQNAIKMAKEDLREEDMRCYMYRVLSEYAEFMRQLDLP